MSKRSAKSILKAKGLIPKHWDLRKTLTSYQQRTIRERTDKYEAVIKNPEKFSSRRYGKRTKTRLKNAGYFGEGDHILIPNFGDKTARTTVSEDYITLHRTLRNGETVTERVYLHSGPKLLSQLQRKFKEPLPPGEYWALKVGDNNTFLSNHAKDLGQLMHYGAAVKLVGSKTDIGWAERHVHLVRFSYDSGKDTLQLPYNPNNPADYSNYKKPRRQRWNNKRGK